MIYSYLAKIIRPIILVLPLLAAACIPMTQGYSPIPPTATPFNQDLQEGEYIRIGSFNLGVFGLSKASNSFVLGIDAKIICSNDITALQEIRDKSQKALPTLVDKVRETCPGNWQYLVSERFGTTSMKEQYVFVYNADTVTFLGKTMAYNDVGGDFERTPWWGYFEVKDDDSKKEKLDTKEGKFDFAFIDVHIDPDFVKREIDALIKYVVEDAARYSSDIIIFGDFNADCKSADETEVFSGFPALLPANTDTTTGLTNCTYDNFQISDSVYEDFTGNSGVYDFSTIFGLTLAQAKQVSDHFPIFAEFYKYLDTDSVNLNP